MSDVDRGPLFFLLSSLEKKKKEKKKTFREGKRESGVEGRRQRERNQRPLRSQQHSSSGSREPGIDS
jgi:hypothetical protein